MGYWTLRRVGIALLVSAVYLAALSGPDSAANTSLFGAVFMGFGMTWTGSKVRGYFQDDTTDEVEDATAT